MRLYGLLIVCISLASCGSDKNAAYTPPSADANVLLAFNFNETSGQSTTENKTTSSFSINGASGSAERIAGLEGNALRTNGWYGWASGSAAFNGPANNVCLSGWVAPSSFPVQRKDADAISDNINAAIFSNVNPSNGAGIALGVNHHGRAIGQFKVGNSILEILSDEYLPLKKWSFLTLNINASEGIAALFLNGVQIKTVTFNAGQLQWSSGATIYLGKESRSRVDATFDTNGLNGAIDDVVLWARSLTTSEIQQAYAAVSPQLPNLTVPISERFGDDEHRPKFHLMPSSGWTNESHGLFCKDGKYHIFAQRNLNGPYWGHLNWGHFESTNLVNWEEKTQVLWPTPGFDEVGSWSGHAVIRDGNPYIIYTGVNKVKAAIGLATSTSPYETWTKEPDPVIAGAPTNILNADFRDPFVFKHGADWYMMVGTGLRNGTYRGGLFLYKSASSDFKQWNYAGTMFEGNPGTDGSGEFWEMPVYYDFGSKAIVLVNKLPNANALYWTGTFNGTQFTKDNAVPERLDIINLLLSPSIATDADGNLTAIGILPDGVSTAKQKEQGWANVLSLPRIWTLEDNKIIQKPHPNLLALRGASQTFENLSFSASSQDSFNGASETQYEIVASMEKGTATKVGFSLLENQATSEKTLIYYDYSNSSFVVDRSNSSILDGVPGSNQATAYSLPADQPINWRIFVDGSVIEVFVNEKLAFATRSFPSAGSNGIDLYAQGGTAVLNQATIYNIEGNGVVSAARQKIEKKNEVNVFPNPSENDFNFCFEDILGATHLQLVVATVSGTPVKHMEAYLNPENACIRWNGNSDANSVISSGTYLVAGLLDGAPFHTYVIKK